MKKSFLFITCDEAKQICDKSQYGEATGWEKFKLNLRLVWCNITRSYSKKNKQLTKVLQSSKVDCLKENERNQIQTEFEKELVKHQK